MERSPSQYTRRSSQRINRYRFTLDLHAFLQLQQYFRPFLTTKNKFKKIKGSTGAVLGQSKKFKTRRVPERSFFDEFPARHRELECRRNSFLQFSKSAKCLSLSYTFIHEYCHLPNLRKCSLTFLMRRKTRNENKTSSSRMSGSSKGNRLIRSSNKSL